MSELGWHGKALATAEKAAQIHRSLADTKAVHRLDLAATLLDFSWRLDQADRHEQASLRGEEAMRLYRQFADNNDPGFWLHIAYIWRIQGEHMEQLEQQTEALLYTSDAIKLYERLGATDAAVQLYHFHAMINQARQLLKLNERAEAQRVCIQAVERCQHLRQRYLPRLLANDLITKACDLLDNLIYLDLAEDATKIRGMIESRKNY